MTEKTTVGNMFGVLDQKVKKPKEKKPEKPKMLLSASKMFSGGSTNWADDDDDDDMFDVHLAAANGNPSQQPVSQENDSGESDDTDTESESESEDEAAPSTQANGTAKASAGGALSEDNAPKKEAQRQLSKKEQKKKELEELDAILNDLSVSTTDAVAEANIETRETKESDEKKSASSSNVLTDSVAAQILEQAGLSLDTKTGAAKKKKGKRRGKKKAANSNEAQTKDELQTVAQSTEGGEGTAIDNDVDIKKLLQAKLKKKKKGGTGGTAGSKASEEEAKERLQKAKVRLQKKKKKKDKTKFNQVAQR